jgi:hypothetical protein
MTRSALEVVHDFLGVYDLIENSTLDDDLCNYILEACSGRPFTCCAKEEINNIL